MPSYLRGAKRDQSVAVKVCTSTGLIYYGFKTKDLAALPNISSSDLTALGHTLIPALPEGALLFFRANSPKPGRCRKTINDNPESTGQTSASTFYGCGQEKAVISAGWDLSTAERAVNLKDRAKSITAIAELESGVLYAFPMNKADFNTYGAALGLKGPAYADSGTKRAKLVMGSSRPKPAKAAIDLAGGSTFSSFVASAAITDLHTHGFYQISGEVRV